MSEARRQLAKVFREMADQLDNDKQCTISCREMVFSAGMNYQDVTLTIRAGFLPEDDPLTTFKIAAHEFLMEG